jgi:aspartate kinase
MKKVVKFGGSSLASARQFKKVKAIIDADKTRCYVVPLRERETARTQK